MANEEQLKILKQGVEAWNQWRKEHPYRRPDLYGANLERANLPGIVLRGATLREANLLGANLERSDLRGANLQEANLQMANLYKANLQMANLYKANLFEANLQMANLYKAKLDMTDLVGADLREADLREANLFEAELFDTSLHSANLYGANLYGANLIQTDLRQTNITGTYLYGTARDDWKIDGIQCDFVYWEDKPSFTKEQKEQEKQWEREHRVPKDRDFHPGEFEERYKQLPTFEYYFSQGLTAIDTVIMARVVDAINQQNPEYELKLDSFHSRGQPHAKFTVREKGYIEEVERRVKADYERKLAALEGQRNELRHMLSTFFDKALQAKQEEAIQEETLSPEERELKRLKRKLADEIPGTPKAKQLEQEIEALEKNIQETE